MRKATIVKRLLENKQITSEEADLLLNKKEETIYTEDKYVSKQEFTKAIKEIKDLIELIVQNPRDQDKLTEEVKEDLISQKDKKLISFLPYLIAFPLQKTLEEEHAWTKINLLKDTLLNYLKFLGLITASEFINSPFKDKNIISSFYKNLAQPSFGSWNAFIRETLQFLNENNHDFFCPELNEYYTKIESGKKRKLYNGEIEIIDAMGDIQLKKQQATAIGMLINFRNRYLGHGLTLDKVTSVKLWEQYYSIFQQLLVGLDWCQNYVIYKNEGKNTWKLQGAEIKQVETLKSKDNIWLQNKKGDKINLVPFFIVPGEVALGDEDTKLLAYESYTGKSIKFFSPEGIDKTTSGRVLDRLNILIKDKQEESPYSPDEFTVEILKDRIGKENHFVLQTLIDERKVIKGIYQSREDIEVKLRSWVGGMANVFFIAAEAGSGKTNLLVEIQRQYRERELNSLLIRSCRMAKSSLKEEIAYLLNIDTEKEISDYKALNQTQEKPLFVLIDGINESQEEQVIWKDIKEISKSFDPGVIKFVVSCRVNGKKDLDRFELEDNKDILYSESKDEVKQLSDAVFWLTPLNMVELEGAWNTYTSKNKKTTNPQFKFNDIADYDRSLYEKIKNPLILRIFLETYHNKPLPKKGKKKLHIWRDWFKSFKEEEKTLLKLLTKKVWEKDNNELELEELINDAELESFIIDDKVNAPFSRLIALGWLSRFNKDNVIIISFTVEGLLFYLLALHLNDNFKIDVKQIEKWLSKKSIIKKSSVESYLVECAEKDDVELITYLIDHGEKTLEITLPSLTEYIKTYGAKKTIDALFDNPTDLDWLALFEINKKLEEIFLEDLRKELLLLSSNFNTYSSINELSVALKTIRIESDSNKQIILNKINENIKIIQSNIDLVHYLSDYHANQNQYLSALECLKIFINENDIDSPEIEQKEKYWTFHRLAKNMACHIYYSNNDRLVETFSYDEAIIWIDKAIEGFKQLKIDCYNSISMKVLIYKFMQSRSDDSSKLLGLYNNLHISPDEINLKIQNLVEDTINQVKETNKEFSFNRFYNYLAQTYAFGKDLKNDKKNRLLVHNCYEKAIEINLKLYGSLHPETANSFNNFARHYQKIEEFDSSIKFSNRSLGILQKVYGENNLNLISPLRDLADTYKKVKDAESAKVKYEEALSISRNNFGLVHDNTANIILEIGVLHTELLKDFSKADQLLTQAKDIALKLDNKPLISICEAYLMINALTEIKEIQIEKDKNYSNAIIELKKLLELPFFKKERAQGGIKFYLGICYEKINQLNKSLFYYKESAEIRKKTKGLKHTETKKVISHLVHIANKMNKIDQLPKWIKDFDEK